jgi:hypothetical protein
MNFREFILNEENYASNLDIASMYFNGGDSIRSLSVKTGKSIAEIYRIVHNFGKPNRISKKHDIVKSLHSSGMGKSSISDFTGYTKRHVSNILKNDTNI